MALSHGWYSTRRRHSTEADTYTTALAHEVKLVQPYKVSAVTERRCFQRICGDPCVCVCVRVSWSVQGAAVQLARPNSYGHLRLMSNVLTLIKLSRRCGFLFQIIHCLLAKSVFFLFFFEGWKVCGDLRRRKQRLLLLPLVLFFTCCLILRLMTGFSK